MMIGGSTCSSTMLVKLDEENFLPWKQQSMATIKGYKLHKYLTSENVPTSLIDKNIKWKKI